MNNITIFALGVAAASAGIMFIGWLDGMMFQNYKRGWKAFATATAIEVLCFAGGFVMGGLYG